MNVIKHTLTFLTALLLAPLSAVTSLAGAVAAWDSVLGNHPLSAGKAFSIVKARLTVGEFKGEKEVTQTDTAVSFTMPLKQGKEICGAYYVSVRRSGNIR